MAETDTSLLAAHEIIHGTQAEHPTVRYREKKFLLERAGNEKPKKLKDLTGSDQYKDSEVAYEDDWVKLGGEAYTGKYYPGFIFTEILTKGIERFHKHPLLFARRDPGYFSIVVNTLREP